MGDDDFLPEGLKQPSVSGGSNSAVGSSYTWHTGLSGGNQIWVVVLSSAALSVSLVALVMMGWTLSVERAHMDTRFDDFREQQVALIEAAEKRATDIAWMAEREARISQDRVGRLEIGLAKKGIEINTDGH